jgi:DNA-binding transcriptional regulator LsrR (DeoR family)
MDSNKETETPIDSESELQARVAWYYFTGGLTQKAIASRLGASQVKINRLLSAARETGQFRITINGELADCVALEHALIEQYGLRQAVVVPAPEERGRLRESLGAGAASHLNWLLSDGMTVALGWGRTVVAMVDSLSPRRLPNLAVVCLQGGLAHCANLNTFEVVSELANLYGADQHFFTAPLYVNGPEARDRLLSQDPIRHTRDKAAAADLGLITMGGMDDSMALTYGIDDVGIAQELREAGAVGDVLGYFIDAEGRLVDHSINDRTVAVPLASLRRIEHTVAVCGGPSRVSIARATMLGGYANVLVTDERTAAELVDT